MLQFKNSLFLSFLVALIVVTPAVASSGKTLKYRDADLPSGVVKMRVNECELESPKGEVCTSSIQVESRMTRFVDRINYEFATNETWVEVSPYQVTKTGEVLWGATYTGRRKQGIFLVQPRWAELHLLGADYALGRLPGTKTWHRIDTITGKSTPIGEGAAGKIPSLYYGTTALKGAFLVSPDGDGSATLVVLSPEGLPTNVTINRVVPAEKLPKDRMSVERMDDATLLVHRLDEKGRVFDQIFNAEATVALTPPLPPLVMADYGDLRRFMFLEIDRERRLFWPVRGSDILSKPAGIIGMRPVSGRFTTQLEPVSAAEQQALYTSITGDPSPYAAEMPRCMVGKRGCDLSKVWAVAWDGVDGVRLSLVGDSKAADKYFQYDLANFTEISASGAAADYTLVRNVTERPENAYGAMVAGGGEVRRIDTLLIASRQGGQFDFLAHGGVVAEKGLTYDLVSVALAPLSSESQAVAYTSSVMNNMRKHEEEEWKRAQAKIQEDATIRRNRQIWEAGQAELARKGRFESSFASRNWQNAIPAAWAYENDAVYRATIAALKSDGGGYIGYAELHLAEKFATPAEQPLLRQHASRLNLQAQQDKRRFAGPQSSSPVSSTATTPYVDTAAKDMSNRIFNSRMNYLEGKTSSYQCGSASFCK